MNDQNSIPQSWNDVITARPQMRCCRFRAEYRIQVMDLINDRFFSLFCSRTQLFQSMWHPPKLRKISLFHIFKSLFLDFCRSDFQDISSKDQVTPDVLLSEKSDPFIHFLQKILGVVFRKNAIEFLPRSSEFLPLCSTPSHSRLLCCVLWMDCDSSRNWHRFATRIEQEIVRLVKFIFI